MRHTHHPSQRIFPLLDSLMFTSSGPADAAVAQTAPNGSLSVVKPRRALVAVRGTTQLVSMFGRLIVDVLNVDPQKVRWYCMRSYGVHHCMLLWSFEF